jgi:glycosyltransferase involved in cell wall biosynthesis
LENEPKVSVVIIFLNEERFLQEAIDSVFAQTFNDWELLLVDDGSTDNSTNIAWDVAREQPNRVRYLNHPDHNTKGGSAARNLGIRHARGEYLAFLDADDVWLPTKLSEQVAILDAENQAAMVYGSTYYWYSWTGNPLDRKRDLLIDPGVQTGCLINSPELVKYFLKEGAVIPCPSDVLLRIDAVRQVGGFEEEFRRLFTDQVFYAKLCLKAAVIVSRKCWFKYRKHQDSSTFLAGKTGQLRSARMNYLNWLERHLKHEGTTDAEIWNVFQRARYRCAHPRLSLLAKQARYSSLSIKELLRSAGRKHLPSFLRDWLRMYRSHQ